MLVLCWNVPEAFSQTQRYWRAAEHKKPLHSKHLESLCHSLWKAAIILEKTISFTHVLWWRRALYQNLDARHNMSSMLHQDTIQTASCCLKIHSKSHMMKTQCFCHSHRRHVFMLCLVTLFLKSWPNLSLHSPQTYSILISSLCICLRMITKLTSQSRDANDGGQARSGDW